MAHQIASSVNCSLDEIDLGALKVYWNCVTLKFGDIDFPVRLDLIDPNAMDLG